MTSNFQYYDPEVLKLRCSNVFQIIYSFMTRGFDELRYLYARRPGTSPPMVVRSVTIHGLRQEIEHAEHERGLRP